MWCKRTHGGGLIPCLSVFQPQGGCHSQLCLWSSKTQLKMPVPGITQVWGYVPLFTSLPFWPPGTPTPPRYFLSTHTHCSYLIRWRESWYALSLCKITKRSVHKQNYLRLNLCGAEILAERKSYSTLFSLVFCQRKRAARETSSASRRGHGNSAAEGRTTCTHRGTWPRFLHVDFC